MPVMRLTSLALAALLLTSACGADEPDGAESESSESSAAPDCATELVVTLANSGTTITLDHAEAVSIESGAAYTMYAADFPLDLGTASLATNPKPEPGGHLASLFVTVFNAEETPPPVEAGAVVPADAESGERVFLVTVASDAEQFITGSGASGTIAMNAVGDAVCADVDYSDGEKSITGTLAADVQAVS